MLEGLGVFQYVRRHVDIAAGSRRRQRLVVRAIVDRHQVWVAREKAVRDLGAWSYLAAVTH